MRHHLAQRRLGPAVETISGHDRRRARPADVDKQPLDAFWNDDNKLTVVPMVHTVGTFFYRTDLVAPNEVPLSAAPAGM